MTAAGVEAYFKAVRPDGTDFRTGTLDYGAALVSGEVVAHPDPDLRAATAAGYLSVSVAAADCTGFAWPCRLLAVEPVGDIVPDPVLPSKRRVGALRVVAELQAWQALGPNGREVAALVERAGRLTAAEARDLAAAWDAAWDAARAAARAAARDAARDAARAAARDAARAAARDAAWAAAGAAVVRDLITPEQYRFLAGPWEQVIGPIFEDVTA